MEGRTTTPPSDPETGGGAQRRPEPSENIPQGILNPGAIDAISVGEDGVVELHVEQTAPWDGSDHLLLLTQEKFWNYLAYVADGELAKSHPHAARDFRVVFDVRDEPDQRTAELLRRVAEEFRRLGGTVLTRRMPADR